MTDMTLLVFRELVDPKSFSDPMEAKFLCDPILSIHG